MKTVVVLIAFISVLANASTVNLKIRGTVETFEDGPVTCHIFSRGGEGGITCSGKPEATRMDQSVFRLDEGGTIERLKIDNQVCYVYALGNQGGISCL